jgi:hypothetical protein
MNCITSACAQRCSNAWQDRSLNSQAFSVLLSSIFALTLGATAMGWSEASASTVGNARVAPAHVPPDRSDTAITIPSAGTPGNGPHGGCELI